MLKIFIYFLIVCLPFSTYSQTTYSITLKDQKFHTSLTSIWIDQVIDTRKEKQYIGFVQRGITNTQVKAVLEGGLENGLKDFINSDLEPSSNSRLLTLRIDNFDISEITNISSELGQVKISAQLFLKSEEGSYFAIKTFETFQTIKGMEVTARHDNNIAKALTVLFNQLTEEDFVKALQNPPFTFKDILTGNSYNEVKEEFIKQKGFAILNEKPKEGFYESFLNFRENNPKSGPNIYLKRKTKNNTLEIIPFYSGSNQKLKDDYWGFCLNDTIYIQTKKEYFPLSFEHNSIYFFAYKGSHPNYYFNPGAGIAFGVIGGAIAGAAASADAGQSEKYELNLLTGEFNNSAFNSIPDLTIGDKSKLVIVRYPKDLIDQDVEVTIKINNEIIERSIGLSEFTEIEISSPFITIWICIDEEKGNCISCTPETDLTKYYTVSLGDRKGVNELKIIEIQRDVADAFINRAKRQAKKAK